MTYSRMRRLMLLALIPLPTLVAGPIDFGRQVRPILSEKCYFCHGPAQQMAGLRLDRPGVSGSALLRRITSQDPAVRMPPWTPVLSLTPAEVRTFETWVAQGLPWPEPGAPPPALERLLQAIAAGDLASIKAALHDRALRNARDSSGATPLMRAALEGNLESMKLLLAAGADPNESNYNGATPLIWAVDDLAKVRLLLAHGAKADARTREGSSALIAAAAFRGSAPVLAALIAAGADPNAANTDGWTPLAQASATADLPAMRLLIDRGAKLNALVAGENAQVAALSPLTAAAYYGTADAVRLLLDRGADANAYDSLGTTGLLFAMVREDRAMIDALLRAGADVNRATPPSVPISDDPGTPLMLAANTESGDPSLVSLLLARGAQPNSVSREGETALARAQKRGRTPVVQALLSAGAKPVTDAAPPSIALPSDHSTDVRAAVEKSLSLLQKSNRTFRQFAGCQSCHNGYLPALAIRMAAELGYSFDREMAETSAAFTRVALASGFEKAVQMMDPDGGSPTSTSYALITTGGPANTVTNAVLRNIAARQMADGRWRPPAFRQPMENDVTATAISLRALQLYAPAARKAQYDRQVQKAAAWLSSLELRPTEQRVFQLLGLEWAKADAGQLQRLASDLWNEQRADGGWAQLSTLPSDAYATGEALYALAEAGMTDGRESGYERGVRFLLATQQSDGSWRVPSRAVRIQQHFESGFPYGKDQFLSASATSWAAMALMLGQRSRIIGK